MSYNTRELYPQSEHVRAVKRASCDTPDLYLRGNDIRPMIHVSYVTRELYSGSDIIRAMSHASCDTREIKKTTLWGNSFFTPG